MLHCVSDIFASIVIYLTIVSIIKCWPQREHKAGALGIVFALEEFDVLFHSELICIGLEFSSTFR